MILLFDFDGTLADTIHGVHASYEYVARAYGQPAPTIQQIRAQMGLPLKDMMRAFFGIADEDDMLAMITTYLVHHRTEGLTKYQLFDGTLDFLKGAARQHQLRIVSNKTRSSLLKSVEQLGLGPIFPEPSMIFGQDPRDPKPKSYWIRQALAPFPEAHPAMLIGDTMEDERAAGDAQIQFMGVTWGYGRWGSLDRRLVKSWDQLAQALKVDN